MKIANSQNSIIAYLKSLLAKKESGIIISKENLKIITEKMDSLIQENANLKGYLVSSHNTKEYSLWLKNHKN